ncbi:MAG: hypothetical protein OXC31_26575 [Spirochaetaceae bacterium]|nr:hypothetical protein [Spirochaetaceae bacterium]
MKNVIHEPVDQAEMTEELVALKEQAGKPLYRSEVRLPGSRAATIVFREPAYEDAEAYIAKQQEDPVGANINLCMSLVVGADSKAAAAELVKQPIALGRWVARAVLPFFGGGAQVETRAL